MDMAGGRWHQPGREQLQSVRERERERERGQKLLLWEI